MGQEFFVNSEILEDKIRKLLPTQGGSGQGFDLSASTQIIPIIDLTESAQGSNLREDLQRASSINTTSTTISNGTATIANTTGYWLLNFTYVLNGSGVNAAEIEVTDGTTTSKVFRVQGVAPGTGNIQFGQKELVVRLRAGETLQHSASATSVVCTCSAHQIADINGNLTNT
jgi:hypothetical protein